MAKVTWTFQALEDIADIAEFHDQHSTHYASFLVEAFLAVEDQLANFPYSGRVVPETNLPVIRELIVHDHRIIYSVISSEEVSILSVRSSKRPLSEFPSSKE
jgi:plasmid stabilization system protein ParE